MQRRWRIPRGAAQNGIVIAASSYEVGAQAEGPMRLTIFLDIGEVNCLRESMPQQSSAGEAVERALHTRNYWGSIGRDVVVECADQAAYELLGYARSACPSAVEKIRAAFSLAELRNSPRGSQRL